MPSLSRELVEHKITIKKEYKPHKIPPRRFNIQLMAQIKVEVEHLVRKEFI